jgi:hypothetical protein
MVSEPVVPAPSAERELASAPTVPAEAAMGKAMAGKAVVEAVPGMMCKGVTAESVPAEAATTESAFAVFVTAVVGPTEPASVTPSSMSKFVGKPASAVMPMSAVESAVPGPAKFRMSAMVPVSMTFVTRPAMPAAMAPGTAKAAMMMVVVTVIASPGKSVAMTVPLAALSPVSLTLTPLASASLTLAALGPFFSASVAPESLAAGAVAMTTLAMRTRSRLYVPHVAVGVASASATLGVLARSSFTMFLFNPCSLIPFGKLTHPAFAAAAASRPGSLVVIVAIRIAVAPSGIVFPRSAGPFASSVIAVCVPIVATIVSHLVRADFVRRQSSPIPMGRELHQSGRRDSAKKQKHVSSHFPTALHPLATRLLSAAAWVTLSGLP